MSGDSQSSPSHSAQHNYLALALLARGHSVVDYNATGDGTTDDTTAVQAAIDACNAAGGGVVFFPEGTYICSTLTWYSNIYGVGVGMQSSILKLKAGTDDDLIKGYNFASLTGGDTVDGIHDFGFRDLKLDGNKDNNASTSWCLRFYGYRPFLQDVWVANGNDGGIYSQGFTSTDPINGANRYGRFSNVEVSSCGGDGVYINGIGDSIFSECVIHNNSGDGIHVGPIGFGVKLYGCHIYGNPHIFTSPLNAKVIAGNIAAGLERIDPSGAAAYRANLAAFNRKIDESLYGPKLLQVLGSDVLDPLAEQGKLFEFLGSKDYQGKKLIDLLGGWMRTARAFQGKKIVTYHKNWVYFTDLFGLTVVDYVEPKPGIPPSARHVKELIEEIQREGVKVILAANYFDGQQVETIAERTGCKAVIVPLGPGGQEASDYISLVDFWIRQLAAALEP